MSSYISERDTQRRKKQIEILEKVFINSFGKTVNFIMYWGAGEKRRATKEDIQAILFVFGALKTIERSYNLKCDLIIIFTDTHAYLNGYSHEQTLDYFSDIIESLNIVNFNHIKMSDLIKPILKEEGINNVNKLIDNIINKCNKCENMNSLPLPRNIRFEYMAKSAKRYSKRVSFTQSHSLIFNSPESSANAYIQLNLKERIIVKEKFQKSIFITYVSEAEDFLLPSLPIMRVFSVRKGFRSRPWFIKEEME